MASVKLVGGKGDFHIRELPDGTKQNACLCVLNADFSKGCLAQVPGKDLLDLVMENNGAYPLEEIACLRDKHGELPDMRCDYCYAMRHNGGKSPSYVVDDNTRSDFEMLKPDVVRLGKNTEVGYQLYRKALKDFLGLCEEFGTKVIMPTKVFEFDYSMVELLNAAGVSILYSIGFDKLEKGVGSQGFHNRWRVEQAELYREAGVNVNLTIIPDVTDSIQGNISRGSGIKYALQSSDRLPKRVLAMRLTSREIAKAVTGFDWDDLKNPKRLFLDGLEKYSPEMMERLQRVPYSSRGDNSLIANFFHSDFNSFMERNASCGKIGDTERCDNCMVPGKGDNFSFPASQLVPVVYDRNRTMNGRSYKERRVIPIKQIPLV